MIQRSDCGIKKVLSQMNHNCESTRKKENNYELSLLTGFSLTKFQKNLRFLLFTYSYKKENLS